MYIGHRLAEMEGSPTAGAHLHFIRLQVNIIFSQPTEYRSFCYSDFSRHTVGARGAVNGQAALQCMPMYGTVGRTVIGCGRLPPTQTRRPSSADRTALLGFWFCRGVGLRHKGLLPGCFRFGLQGYNGWDATRNGLFCFLACQRDVHAHKEGRTNTPFGTSARSAGSSLNHHTTGLWIWKVRDFCFDEKVVATCSQWSTGQTLYIWKTSSRLHHGAVPAVMLPIRPTER